MKNFVFFELFKIIKEEFRKSNGENKYLILTIIANLPTPFIFMPYVTQAITLILVLLYFKQVITNKSQNIYTYILVPTILLAQFIWMAFVTQLITILLVGLLLSTKKT